MEELEKELEGVKADSLRLSGYLCTCDMMLFRHAMIVPTLFESSDRFDRNAGKTNFDP